MEKKLTSKELKEQNLSEYENACDYLYYGYPYADWKRANQRPELSDADASRLWRMAKSRLARGHRY